MSKLCVYIMTSDRGFAPKIEQNICRLKGCMKHNIEKNAEVGDWIIGIGGKTLAGGKYDRKLIYVMKVEENDGNAPKSRDFYHFGNKAIDLPKELNKLFNVKRFKYFRQDEYPDIIRIFEKFIRRYQKGKNGAYCDSIIKTCKGNSVDT